ncbi:hypothetical protein CDL15_Pgr001764 [Punica granatum]|uniref:Uncharacterized protein n=1 Tax=Punica granatum TaxID=22663 RepID=A0A218XBU8_PUNGR|nr:hypothetical protein CDL15_Pgr001764 [Punica granatum]PKI58709.1 hypothetical protein CRG98_020865 [Punica granatum]
MSIEALAMAGVDYAMCNIDFEALEHFCLSLPPPSYLLLHDDDDDLGTKAVDLRVKKEKINAAVESAIFSELGQWTKEPEKQEEKLQQWSKCAAASINKTTAAANPRKR